MGHLFLWFFSWVLYICWTLILCHLHRWWKSSPISLGFFFTQLAVFLVVAKRFSFVTSHLSAVGLDSWVMESWWGSPSSVPRRVPPSSSSASASVSGFTLGLRSISSKLWWEVVGTGLISLCRWTFRFPGPSAEGVFFSPVYTFQPLCQI